MGDRGTTGSDRWHRATGGHRGEGLGSAGVSGLMVYDSVTSGWVVSWGVRLSGATGSGPGPGSLGLCMVEGGEEVSSGFEER
jgi:hypothetical protein